MKADKQKEIDDFFDKAEGFTKKHGAENVTWESTPDGDCDTKTVEHNDSQDDISVEIWNSDEEEYFNSRKKVYDRNQMIDENFPDLTTG